MSGAHEHRSESSGDFVGRVTLGPIPNTEVKPAGADGTAQVTPMHWGRKSPGIIKQKPSHLSGLFRIFISTASVKCRSRACCLGARRREKRSLCVLIRGRYYVVVGVGNFMLLQPLDCDYFQRFLSKGEPVVVNSP